MIRLVAVTVVALCVVVPASALAAYPGENGKIAFSSTRPIPGVCDPCSPKVYTMNADGSDVSRLDPSTTDLQSERDPDWSPDGTGIAYGRGGMLATIKADGTDRSVLVAGSDPSWSPDGTRIAFGRSAALYVVNADGTAESALVPEPHCDTIPEDGASCTRYDDPSWAPDGSGVAYAVWQQVYEGFPRNTWVDNAFYIPRTGGPGFINDATAPDWSPDASKVGFITFEPDIYSQDVATAAPNGANRSVVGATTACNGNPAWSPDGTKIAFEVGACGHGEDSEIYVMDADGSNVVQLTDNAYDDQHPSWQPIPVNGYPRPRSASPLRVSLVPAYEQCTSPNRTHGPPLAFGSCNPPVETSGRLTVGTPDANGAAPGSVGSVRLSWVGELPIDPDNGDQGDVRIEVSVTDVRNRSDLTDYTGELEVTAARRITDKLNSPHPGGPGAATVQDETFAFTVPCAPTPAAGAGATCALTTTADTLVPGTVTERTRAIWQLGQIVVYDGGADGDAGTMPNSVFARQGVFIP